MTRSPAAFGAAVVLMALTALFVLVAWGRPAPIVVPPHVPAVAVQR